MGTRRSILKTGTATAVILATGGAGAASLATGPASAAPRSTADRADLQAALDQVVANGASGALAEFRDGASLWRGVGGVAELGTTRPVPANGRFRIGSVTKSYVATVVLQLVGEDRVRLDDTIDRWLPGAVPNGDRITVRNLLQHTSGVYNYTLRFADIYPTTDELLRQRYRHWSLKDLIALTVEQPPDFEPGTSWSYSNTNYVLLGMLIERVTGRRYAAEIERRILRPLGLRDTELPGDDPQITGPHSHGYLPQDRDGETLPVDITSFNMSVGASAGEIISTAADVNQFFRALTTGHLLPPALLDEMFANPAGPGYGLGVEQTELDCGETLWGHTGTWYGFSTHALTTADGRRQLTLSLNPWGEDDHGQALTNLLETAFCGSPTGVRHGS